MRLGNILFRVPHVIWPQGRRQHGWYTSGTLGKQFTKPTPTVRGVLSLSKLVAKLLQRAADQDSSIVQPLSSVRGHQSGHFGPLSEVQRPLRVRGGERDLLLLLGAPPLPLEAAAARGRRRRLRPLPRLGGAGLAAVAVGGELEHVVGRGDGRQVGAVPEMGAS